MTHRDGRIWGVIPVREEDKKHGEVEFEIKDTLTLYEAARIASGRHPYPRALRGAGMDLYWSFLTAGIKSEGWQHVRPQRSVDMLHAAMNAIKQDTIKPTRLVCLPNGDIDWRTRIKTEDAARICLQLR